MHTGKIIFSQVMEFLPLHEFHKCVERYQGHYQMKKFSCFDQFLIMAFAQLTYRESLRDIEVCLKAQSSKLYHMGIRSNVSRSTVADANERRDWRIYADFAQVLIYQARSLYQNDELAVELQSAVYALDSSTIDLCLSLFSWAHFRKTKGAVKLHTLLDLRGSIPAFLQISDGKLHDVHILDVLTPEPGSFYLFDRGYIDFERLYCLTQVMAFFVTRAKDNMACRRLYSHPVQKESGLICDQTVVLTNFQAHKDYPDKLRRVKFFDSKNEKRLVFLTNNFILPALTIAQLYQCRWQVELFFKWIKQHLRIKKFFGTSENAVKTQIWIAVSVYLLVAILKKKLNLKENLYTILQILSLTLFERMPILQALAGDHYKIENNAQNNQLILFNY